MSHAAAMKRAALRAERRDRANARVAVPIPADLGAQDPLRHDRRAGAAFGALLVFGAIVAHAVVIAGLWGAGGLIRAFSDKLPDPRDKVVELTMIEPPPPPPPEPEPEPPPPEPEPEAKPEPKPKPKPKPKAPPPPPPDPIDVPKDPPPPPPPNKPPPRRIVGLSMESTVKGGSGPSFAVGNTRMGQTSDKAANPNEAKPLPKTQTPPPKSTRVNRAATRVPTDECKLEMPLPRGPQLEPKYPKDYEAQGLEAKVVLELRIGTDGRVKSAKVVKGTKFSKFDEAALATAKKQRFTVASCKGKPGTEREVTIAYSYNFKLPD